ncbi:MAG: TetR/AcrR family transcriptional regulator, partial [Actinomycetota bacterium]|nr:TetR/AcrR family transcriptional regulator [Actinomycetota bacterium]
PRRSRARRGEGERLRDEILEGASKLLAATGDADAVSVRAVADAVGVTPPSIYLHFADKAELLTAVCERHFRALHSFVEEAVDGTDDPEEQLRRRGRAYVRFGIEHPEEYRVLFMRRPGQAALPPAEDAREVSGFAALVANVQRAMEAGVIAGADPLLVASGLWSVVHGITSLAISLPGFPQVGLDALVDHVLEVHCRGLRPPPPPVL